MNVTPAKGDLEMCPRLKMAQLARDGDGDGYGMMADGPGRLCRENDELHQNMSGRHRRIITYRVYVCVCVFFVYGSVQCSQPMNFV